VRGFMGEGAELARPPVIAGDAHDRMVLIVQRHFWEDLIIRISLMFDLREIESLSRLGI
jgi:hypothetical protein